MSRYATMFTRLKQQQHGAFIPFVTIGDPNLELSLQIIQTLITAGADALELGIAFSDPLADGPTIQAANIRALNSGSTPSKSFALIKQIRQQYPDIPIGILTYANIVLHQGISQFYANCANAGVDSVLIADVPIEESIEFSTLAKQHGVAPVFICPPNATEQNISQIAANSQGYTYLVSRSGVTGSENNNFIPLQHIINSLTKSNAAPAIQGFGISTTQQVKQALEQGAMGVISGSAITKIIEQNLLETEPMLQLLTKFVITMKSATKLT